jgi:hypothetical protein
MGSVPVAALSQAAAGPSRESTHMLAPPTAAAQRRPMGGPSGSDPGVGAHPGEKGPSATTARVTKKLLATFICLLQRELEVSPAAHGARLAEANSKRWVGECVSSSGWVVCPRGLLALPTCQLHGACAVLGETSGGRWEHWRRRGQGKGWRRARVKRARAAPEGRGAAVRQGVVRGERSVGAGSWRLMGRWRLLGRGKGRVRAARRLLDQARA